MLKIQMRNQVVRKPIIAFICLLLVLPCRARTITVDDDGIADFNNIQAAINDSNDNDVIIVRPGIYTGWGNRDIDFNGLAITVRSIDPNDPNTVAATIIDCNGTETEPHRGFCFDSGEDANSILDGLTITNGFASGDWPAYHGGAIACYNQSSPTIRNCLIINNQTVMGGGGIYCYQSNPTLKDCIISNNFADFGGGMYNSSDSNSILINCTFNENIVTGDYGDGGGMANQLCAPTIVDCNFIANTAVGYGGAGISNRLSSPTLIGCTFNENQAAGTGGAVRNYKSSPFLTNCVFKANLAGGGGGIYNVSYSSPTLTNCIFSANSAYYGGAMSNWYYCNPEIINCILAANTAVYGGAIETYTAGPVLANCTLAANSASISGNALFCDSYEQIHPSSVSITNSILWDSSNEIWNNDNSTIVITYSNILGGWPGLGNINADPCFVLPGYWDSNNTPDEPNDDFWVDGDYHLKSRGWRWDAENNLWTHDDVTSRCIDAGNPGSPLGKEPLSVPGDPNNHWGRNLRIDMGAYGGTAQASIPPHGWAILADLTNDGIADFSDLENWTEDWLNNSLPLTNQPGDLDRNKTVDFFDFALFAQDWLKQTSWHK
jgi:hypothetical protein